jgi:hypothetical protein
MKIRYIGASVAVAAGLTGAALCSPSRPATYPR